MDAARDDLLVLGNVLEFKQRILGLALGLHIWVLRKLNGWSKAGSGKLNH